MRGFASSLGREQLDEVPIVLIRPGSFTVNTPPNMLITDANIKAIKVKV